MGLSECCEPSGGGVTVIGCIVAENRDLQCSCVLWAAGFLDTKERIVKPLIFDIILKKSFLSNVVSNKSTLVYIYIRMSCITFLSNWLVIIDF